MFIFIVGWIQVGWAFAQESNSNNKEQIKTSDEPKIKIGSLIQLWNTTNFKNETLGYETFNTFRVRRVQAIFSGVINDRISTNMMVDFARILPSSLTEPDSAKGKVDKANSKQSAYSILQDVYITYLLEKKNKIEMRVGQFKYPLTYEGLQSNTNVDFVDRAEITKTFGDKRDIGIQFSAKPKMFEVTLMLVQGNSQNKTDVNRQKDLAGRMVIKPLPDLSFGASFYNGRAGDDGKIPQNRHAFEVVYKHEALTVYSEAVFAKDAKIGPARSQKGWYAAALYNVNESWQPVFRYEWVGKNFELLKKIPRQRLTMGGNYFIQKNAKIQFNYIYGAFSNTYKKTLQHTIMINWQVNF